jgi:hypothetical protein
MARVSSFGLSFVCSLMSRSIPMPSGIKLIESYLTSNQSRPMQ